MVAVGTWAEPGFKVSPHAAQWRWLPFLLALGIRLLVPETLGSPFSVAVVVLCLLCT